MTDDQTLIGALITVAEYADNYLYLCRNPDVGNQAEALRLLSSAVDTWKEHRARERHPSYKDMAPPVQVLAPESPSASMDPILNLVLDTLRTASIYLYDTLYTGEGANSGANADNSTESPPDL